MFAVIKNVYGSFTIDESGLNLDEAIALCGDIIHKSHGGQAHVVSDETAVIVDGQDCDDVSFVAYGINGHPYQV